jgi:hypothetical protein
MGAIDVKPAFENVVGDLDELIAVCGAPGPAI